MMLLTKEIKSKLPKLYAIESIPLMDKEIVCKFFNPTGLGTWYVIEGEEEDGDFRFFGLVDLFEMEFGYFSLNELESLHLPLNQKIERDLHFSKNKISQVYKKEPLE